MELHTSSCILLLLGGAISNMYSIMAARYKFFPEVKTKGMAAVPKLVLFTSEHVSWVLFSWIMVFHKELSNFWPQTSVCCRVTIP